MLFHITLHIESRDAWKDLIKIAAKYDALDDGFEIQQIFHSVISGTVRLVAQMKDASALGRVICFLQAYGTVAAEPVVALSVAEIGRCGRASPADRILTGLDPDPEVRAEAAPPAA